jgi:hypothetical protein
VAEGCTHDQVADENLHDLGLQALAALEDLLQQADEDVAQGRADHGAVQGHLGHARGEVVAALAPVVRNPRREELLQARQRARGEDLGAQRVALQLLEVRLAPVSAATPHFALLRNTHCEVAVGAAALGQRLPDLVDEAVLSLAHCVGNRARRRRDRLLFKLDRHGALNRVRRSGGGKWARLAGCGSRCEARVC